MEIIVAIVFTLILGGISVACIYVQSLMCQDCPLKERCKQSIEKGNGCLCDDKNNQNQLMTTPL